MSASAPDVGARPGTLGLHQPADQGFPPQAHCSGQQASTVAGVDGGRRWRRCWWRRCWWRAAGEGPLELLDPCGQRVERLVGAALASSGRARPRAESEDQALRASRAAPRRSLRGRAWSDGRRAAPPRRRRVPVPPQECARPTRPSAPGRRRATGSGALRRAPADCGPPRQQRSRRPAPHRCRDRRARR